MKHRYIKNVATLELYEDKCTNCGICIDVCPHNVFEMVEKKLTVVDKDACMECGACKVNCPFLALEVDAGVGCAYAIVNGMITGGEPSCDCGGGDEECGTDDGDSGCCDDGGGDSGCC